MTLTIDMRRTGVLILALLVFLAVVGPACLVLASSALAMPMDSTSDCNGGSSSMAACPHETPIEGTSHAPGDGAPQIAMLELGPVPAPAFASRSLAVSALSVAAEPVAHLTPLRL